MSRLYELTEEYEAVLNMLYDGETEEQIIFDTIEGIEGEIENKADNYAKMIKSMLADAECIKAEEDRLASRRRSLESRAKKLKDTRCV